MKAVDRLFELTGRSVDDRLAGMAKTARTVLEEIQRTDNEPRAVAGQKRRRPTIIGRWAARQLDLCAKTFERPPPKELVDLFNYLHDAAAPFTTRPLANQWYRAAHHKALHPDASLREIAAASGVSHTLCRDWLKNDPDFAAEIDGVRQVVKTHGIKKVRRLGLLAV